MARLFKVALYLFALVGVLVSAGAGYLYSTNSDLAGEFWNVRGEVQDLPDDRRKEVIAELPQRIKFENDVRQDMQALPAERQTELYDQLRLSREQVFEQFAKRIAAEAEIARKVNDAKQATRQIVETLGKVNVGVNLKAGTVATPRPDRLAEVEDARTAVSEARVVMRDAHRTSDSQARVEAAVGMLQALELLGDRIVDARGGNLSDSEQRRLSNIVMDARETLMAIRQTPGIDQDPRAKPLLSSVPPKLQ